MVRARLTVPLHAIEGLQLESGYKIHVEMKQRKYFEQKDFQVYVLDEDGCRSDLPVVTGIHSAGRGSIGIRGWMDIEYIENSSFRCGRNLNLSSSGLDVALFRILGRSIPAGGSIMMAYQMFWGRSGVHEETARLLQRGIPPELTPIGVLLLHAGCLSFKDWYWPEGGREGPQKLQGLKPVDQEQAKLHIKRILSELESFSAKETGDDETWRNLREQALKVAALLRSKG